LRSITFSSSTSPLVRGEIRAEGDDVVAAVPPQVGGGLLDAGVLGCDQQVVAVLGELLGQLEADPAGRAGHHGEFVGRSRHAARVPGTGAIKHPLGGHPPPSCEL
jgi:hypothetical protein